MAPLSLHEDSLLQEASDILVSLGVQGLCHPTSDEFAPSFPICSFETATSSHRALLVEGEEESYIQNGLLALVCVCVAALAAGLTMGLMSLDPLVLLIKMKAGATEKERKQAEGLLPIVKQHHRLLVTLLLLNSMANEALPLFLDALVPSYVAVILSVTLVLFFGEIIPSAVFTGPNQIQIASHLAPLVRLVMLLLYPLAYPIAKVLDMVLHDENETGGIYNRGELSALVRIQYEERLAAKRRRQKERNPDTMPSHSQRQASLTAAKQMYHAMERSGDQVHAPHEQLAEPHSREPSGLLQRTPSIHFDEVHMVEGALSMKTKVVMDVYTPLRRVFSIPENTLLDERNTVRIYSSGYSRVPVFRPNPEKPKDKTQIIGILISKQLIVVNHHDCRPVSTLPLNIPFCVSPKMNLVDAINMFQTGGLGAKGGHLALVCARPDLGEAALDRREPLPESAGLMGIVTLEDALEQLLQEQILDEMDKLERNEARLAEWAYKKWRIFVKKEQLKRETDEVEALERPKMSSVVDQAIEQDRAKKMPPNIFSPLLGGKKSEGEDESGSRSFKLPFFS